MKERCWIASLVEMEWKQKKVWKLFRVNSSSKKAFQERRLRNSSGQLSQSSRIHSRNRIARALAEWSVN